MIHLCPSDLSRVITYLDDASKLYDALAALPMQRAASRAFMIRQLNNKLKLKLKNDKARHY